jgi:hypothetical protein
MHHDQNTKMLGTTLYRLICEYFDVKKPNKKGLIAA